MAIEDIKETGLKDDTLKSRIDLILPDAILAMGNVLEYGARKYEPNSWQNVDDGMNVHYAALMRHALAWHNGEYKDKETGYSHMAHVLTNAMFCLYHEQTKLMEEQNEHKAKRTKC